MVFMILNTNKFPIEDSLFVLGAAFLIKLDYSVVFPRGPFSDHYCSLYLMFYYLFICMFVTLVFSKLSCVIQFENFINNLVFKQNTCCVTL